MKALPVWKLKLNRITVTFNGYTYRVTEYPSGFIDVYEYPSVWFPVRGHSVVAIAGGVDVESVISVLEDYANERHLYVSRYRENKFWRSCLPLQADAAGSGRIGEQNGS